MKLNRIVVALVAAFSFVSTSFAQNSEFRKGDVLVNVLYSLGSFDGYKMNAHPTLSVGHEDIHLNWDEKNFLQHGIGFTAEWGILDNMIHGKGAIGIGIEGGMGFGRDEQNDIFKQTAKRIHFATRGTMHYSFVPAIDTYAGFRLGICDWTDYNQSIKDSSGEWVKVFDGKFDGDFIYNFVCGARYMPVDNFGFNLELSSGRYSFVSLGVSFKF